MLGQGAGMPIVAGTGGQLPLSGCRGSAHVQGHGEGTPHAVGSQGRESP